jgi:hypothetical protein
MHHFLANLKLNLDVPDILITPTLEEACCVVEESVKTHKRTNVFERAVPSLFHHLSKPQKAWPN